MKKYLYVLFFGITVIIFPQSKVGDYEIATKDTLISCQLAFQRNQWWIYPNNSDLVWMLFCDYDYYNELLENYRDENVILFGNILQDNLGRKMFTLADSSTSAIGTLDKKIKLRNGLLYIMNSGYRDVSIYLDSKLIYEIDVFRLTVIKTLSLGSNDILIINEDDAAAVLPGGQFRIISINNDKNIFITDKFSDGEKKPKVTSSKNKVILEFPKYWNTPVRKWEFSNNNLVQIK